MRFLILTSFASAALSSTTAAAAPITVPFDFSRGEIVLDAMIDGEPVSGLLDTGVDPSVIDLSTAARLHLAVQKHNAGEASGEGDNQSAQVYPATIARLAIGSKHFRPVKALASDMQGMSDTLGRPINFILGYSFLKRQPVLVDYVNNTLVFLADGDEAIKSLQSCRLRFEEPLKLLKGLNWPVIRSFRFGPASAPVSLDTGSSGDIALYQSALALGDLRTRLKPHGTVQHGGFRGDATINSYELEAPIGFGPFQLPAGQAVTIRKDIGSIDTRVANVGNRVFAAMKLKMLLDYPGRRIIFWGDCP